VVVVVLQRDPGQLASSDESSQSIRLSHLQLALMHLPSILHLNSLLLQGPFRPLNKLTVKCIDYRQKKTCL
jgi:hypothetical protein